MCAWLACLSIHRLNCLNCLQSLFFHGGRLVSVADIQKCAILVPNCTTDFPLNKELKSFICFYWTPLRRSSCESEWRKHHWESLLRGYITDPREVGLFINWCYLIAGVFPFLLIFVFSHRQWGFSRTLCHAQRWGYTSTGKSYFHLIINRIILSAHVDSFLQQN